MARMCVMIVNTHSKPRIILENLEWILDSFTWGYFRNKNVSNYSR